MKISILKTRVKPAMLLFLLLSAVHQPLLGQTSSGIKRAGSLNPFEPVLHPIHFGVKSWGGIRVGSLNNLPLGIEGSIGPFIEWRVSKSFGIQTGIVYSYREAFRLSVKAADAVDGAKFERSTFSALARAFRDDLKQQKEEKRTKSFQLGKKYRGSLDYINLHTLSFPLVFRVYPEKTKQLVLFFGFRFLKHIKGKDVAQLLQLNLSNRIIYNFAAHGLNLGGLMHFLNFVPRPSNKKTMLKLYNYPSISWDLGLEFNGIRGLILGINKLGLVLGYDVTRLFLE